MRKHTSAADSATVAVKVVVVTLDAHFARALERAEAILRRDLPGLSLTMHAASDWRADPDSLARCREDIAGADIVLATMLFMEDHIEAVLPALQARQSECDAMVCAMSAGEVIRLTRMGGFRMDGAQRGPLGLLRRLRGARKGETTSSGARQLRMLRQLPRILRFIPGTAQDVRAYFMVLQYWLAGTDANLAGLVASLVNRYADGPRRGLRGRLRVPPPETHRDVGLYHPRLPRRTCGAASELPRRGVAARGRVGLLLMRSYVLAGDTAHYDGVIEALEARGLDVVPAFASGLDARPAIESYFLDRGRASVDAVVSLTGFSLVGGPAYNDAGAAVELLARLDVPYLSAHPMEFQSLDEWQASQSGLHPVEATMMVALPELDGATVPMVIGGRRAGRARGLSLEVEPERAAMLAARAARLVELRRTPRCRRRLALLLFGFPPNAGSVGTAAHLAVFESLHNTLGRLAAEGYEIGEVPADPDALRACLLGGNAERFGAEANVVAFIDADDHIRREPWLDAIEAEWGPAPGRHLTDGERLFVLGRRFGNVLVAVQPGFGYEGDPMRLMFEQGFAPTHAFSAFYRYLREDFEAAAVLHFGTHGALEFMPGKQTGLGAGCWPDRLIGDLPNYYLYAANNPSEGTIAKRRSAATLVSYLTPSLTQAGLHRDLADLKTSIDRWRTLPPAAVEERARLGELVLAQATEIELAPHGAEAEEPTDAVIAGLAASLHEIERTLIPEGLHVVGKPPSREQRLKLLSAIAHAGDAEAPPPEAIEAMVANPAGNPGASPATTELERLARIDGHLREDHELDAIVAALDAGYVKPVPGGDVVTTPEVLPTGRNLHGFDPYRIPSALAVADGARLADDLLARHAREGGDVPELVALVLWGTDNLKTQGAPVAQALALMGAKPRYDGYGKLAGAALVPLEELGRPRIDVMMTLSGIFRDLLPLQTRMLAEAAWLAASADESPERNFVRKHALKYREAHGCDLETAALRIFSNPEGAYGSNVNHLVDQGCWSDEGELADTYARRKCFAYGRGGVPARQAGLMQSMLGDVQLAYQNLESIELGVTTVDHYFDTLGGIASAVERARGEAAPVYIADQTRGGRGSVRTLAEQVALESRTRVLNPVWYERMLEHGYEGVRQIDAHVTNTLGWSATTGQVASWVYRRIGETFVLDDAMRERLAELNPIASARVANRLLEAHEREYWSPDTDTLAALRRAGDALEDRIEGIGANP